MRLASFVSCAIAIVRAREVVPFNFAWRWQLSSNNYPPSPSPAPASSCSRTNFSDFSHVRCMGLTKMLLRNATASDCARACCVEKSCELWQYDTHYTDPSRSCFVAYAGYHRNCSQSQHWIGGERSAKPAPLPPYRPVPVPPSLLPAHVEFNDSSWTKVDLPHDYRSHLPNTAERVKAFSPPFNRSWYRKIFRLPEEWSGSRVYIRFEGIFRSAAVFCNGQAVGNHTVGYTRADVRLDIACKLSYGAGLNAVSVYVDPTFVRTRELTWGSGWWYEGAGLYRDVFLIRTHPVHLALTDGVYAASEVVAGTIVSTGDALVSRAVVSASFEIADPTDHSHGHVAVRFRLIGNNMSTTSRWQQCNILPGTHRSGANCSLTLQSAQLWSVRRPFTYELQAQVLSLSSDNTVLDEVNTTIGIRAARWDAQKGFFLNDQRVRLKGFCNHNSFAGVGVAVPDRINLLRAQQLRGLGANAWRMSHNPPNPVLLDILDRLGVSVWDENRQFDNHTDHVQAMADMVRRDRNHPSVMIWSFCNENHCNKMDWYTDDRPIDQVTVGKMFKAAKEAFDPPWERNRGGRPSSANMVEWGNRSRTGYGPTLSSVLDVQGFSHGGGHQGAAFHRQFPDIPVVNSECCSCRTQRGVYNWNTTEPPVQPQNDWNQFAADCLRDQTLDSGLAHTDNAGAFIWTLHDYIGEAGPADPVKLSSSFGQYDLAGFEKASASWFRAWWLAIADAYGTGSRPEWDRPPVPEVRVVHIVQDLQPESRPPAVRAGQVDNIAQVYSSEPVVELFLNGRSLGRQHNANLNYTEWRFKFETGNLTAVGYANAEASSASVVHMVLTATQPYAIRLSLDTPSPRTGTGERVLADGADVALVRATIVDKTGRFVASASNVVTFSVVSGAGRIIGVGNGDPAALQTIADTGARAVFHGLARAIVQSSEVVAMPWTRRRRVCEIDADRAIATQTQRTPVVCTEVNRDDEAGEIVVQASSPGLQSARLSIPLSYDAEGPEGDGVLAVAARSVNQADLGAAAGDIL